jgi:hypothetical protein
MGFALSLEQETYVPVVNPPQVATDIIFWIGQHNACNKGGKEAAGRVKMEMDAKEAFFCVQLVMPWNINKSKKEEQE